MTLRNPARLIQPPALKDKTKTPAASASRGEITLTFGKFVTRMSPHANLNYEGCVGIKEEPLFEVDSIQRAINQMRGIHPPPIMNIDGQQFPLVVEGSPVRRA